MDATTPQDRPPIEHRRIPARVAPRRRPSGEAPPLPHHLGRTGKFWLIMVGYFVATGIGVLFFPAFARVFERWDTERLQWLAAIRTQWLTDTTLAVNVLAASWTIRILRWGTFAGVDRLPAVAAPLRVPRRHHRARAARVSDRRWGSAGRARSA